MAQGAIEKEYHSHGYEIKVETGMTVDDVKSSTKFQCV